jgi:hypothetical protein
MPNEVGVRDTWLKLSCRPVHSIMIYGFLKDAENASYNPQHLGSAHFWINEAIKQLDNEPDLTKDTVTKLRTEWGELMKLYSGENLGIKINVKASEFLNRILEFTVKCQCGK